MKAADDIGRHDVRITKIAPALLLAVGLGIVGLTGCTAGSAPASSTAPSTSMSQESSAPEGAEDQPVAAACATAVESVSDIQAGLTDVSTDASEGNFAAVAQKLGTLRERMTAAAGAVGNAEVEAALATMAEKVGAFADVFAGVPDGDLAALGAKAEEIQTLSQEVADAGQALSEVCTG
jgi:hypothetical protein